MKYHCWYLILGILIYSSSLFSQESNDRIPFIITEYQVIPSEQLKEALSPQNNLKNNQYLVKKETVSYLAAEDISNVIKATKKSLCSTIEEGSFKVWLKVEASRKVLGIGGSGESGIEVTFDCKKK